MREAHAALASWADWGPLFREPPKLVRELGGGLTNRSFLIEAGKRQFVLRLASPHDTLFGIDRHREQRILADAAAAGIAPPVHHHSVEHGILVSTYVDGKAFEPGPTATGTNALVELARRIHALPTEIAVEDYYAHAERYRQRLESAGIALPAPLAALDDRIRDEHACGSDKPDAIRVCHRDLNRANIIDCAGRLYVIDWEVSCGQHRARRARACVALIPLYLRLVAPAQRKRRAFMIRPRGPLAPCCRSADAGTRQIPRSVAVRR
jgi:thiamine kinase-like enzyme